MFPCWLNNLNFANFFLSWPKKTRFKIITRQIWQDFFLPKKKYHSTSGLLSGGLRFFSIDSQLTSSQIWFSLGAEIIFGERKPGATNTPCWAANGRKALTISAGEYLTRRCLIIYLAPKCGLLYPGFCPFCTNRFFFIPSPVYWKTKETPALPPFLPMKIFVHQLTDLEIKFCDAFHSFICGVVFSLGFVY